MNTKNLLIVILLFILFTPAQAEIIKWLGGDTNFETDATDPNNWSLDRIPADGDTLMFDDTAVDIPGGSTKYDCNWSDWSGVLQCAGIYIDDEYNGDIGTTDYIWEVACANSTMDYYFVYEGGGNCYVTLKDDGDANEACKGLLVDSAGGMFIYSDDVNDTWGGVKVFSGSLNAGPNTAMESLVTFGGITTVDVNCTQADGGDIDVICKAGTVYFDSELGSPEIFGGTFYWGSAGNAGSTPALECDLLSVYGGTFYWRVQAESSGTSILKQFYVYDAGVLDASTAVGAAGAKQIGSGSNEVSEIWFGGQGKFNNGNNNISVNSGSSIYSYGGTVTVPSGQSITW